MITTNFYSNNEAISLALKIKRLQILEVPFELSVVKGIGGKNAVCLTWDEVAFKKALNEEEP